VEALITSGEDLVDNFVKISYSLKNILERVDRGEGLLGELTTTPETKQRLTDTLLTTLNKTNAALAHIESGKGVMGKLIYDDAYGERLTRSIGDAAASLQSVTAQLQTGFETRSGAVPALFVDPEGKQRVFELVDNLRTASSNLAEFTETMQTGEGLIPRLMTDREYADQALTEFTLLVTQLNETVRKINSGEGTAGKLIADPSVYEAINDILIGINESSLLRWMIRNRQQAGIERRVEEMQQAPPAPPVTTTTPVTTPAPVTTDTTGTPPPEDDLPDE
jgi:phospholipid/cholesterol/gamma-HCH transport system substrate-binding protein